jgi:thioredoxin-related protein
MLKTIIATMVIAGMILVAQTSKIEMTYIYSSNCHWCDRFNAEVLQDPEVKILMKDITVRKLDLYDPAADMYGPRAVPYIIFRKNGAIVKKFVGYVTKEQFITIVKEVIDETVV